MVRIAPAPAARPTPMALATLNPPRSERSRRASSSNRIVDRGLGHAGVALDDNRLVCDCHQGRRHPPTRSTLNFHPRPQRNRSSHLLRGFGLFGHRGLALRRRRDRRTEAKQCRECRDNQRTHERPPLNGPRSRSTVHGYDLSYPSPCCPACALPAPYALRPVPWALRPCQKSTPTPMRNAR